MSIITDLTRMWLTRSAKPFLFQNEYDQQLPFSQCEGLGLYVHIPFCRELCGFCPYCKVQYDRAVCDRYLDRLIQEIHLVGGQLPGRKRVTSLYFGGGTPALAAGRLKEVMEAIEAHFIITEGVGVELHPEDVDEGLLRFACYVAVCYTVYGLSFEYLTTEHILGLVSQLRPNMVKELKTNGSGKLPPNIQKRKTKHLTASANDAFATIRITARESTEECYAEILDYLCAVLEQEEFPHSYSIEFRGPEKIYLPIPGLPKKGVNQLFACAVQHPNLHPAIERYARLAMREYEWYNNLSDESCAMPGSFAVFALGLEGEQWTPLVTEYLDLCDDEHSSLQEKFLHALIRKFGFQAWTLGVLVRGALSMQWLKPAKEFRSLIANAESLDALLTVKRRFSAYLLPEENEDPKFRAIAWQSLLWAIWGSSSENGGSKVIKSAPKELKEKYQQVFS